MMIQLKSVSRTFGNRTLFRDINEKFVVGELVGISGKSGSGKSTLLNIIGLIDSDYEGELLIDSIATKNISKRKKEQLVRENINYLFQNYALIDNESVRYNLELVLKKKDDHKLDAALKLVGLDRAILETPIYILSGGEQQRVALARCILKKGNIVLADEPTGNLDQENAEIVMGILSEFTKQGKVVVIVSHSKEIMQLCDRVIEL
ncbi:ATP-binding cassette domain-containing protein [Erysipelothrix rhusiopathiae]|uniref:ATP-binding cassette domain-containing protein n=2 Tax=Erysipelothrix rhusiopathiae TaxID=1648 RepID=UPI000210B57D|nr:ATP-binding cassette domain-containing protein [Erysipelothrix rhusiopathiae]AGN23903.1 ABC transporter ATP-binding protein [Erysipelothrix rhusiopathiae SY1027]AMS11300.1 bacteriocin ABC transporter ATP-binding protein [Erysipelothrix rhusiopathiae]AWU41344.1 ATP-binding cassette domain-containing protein [Erysipelothrix rhusiopathiae]MDE8284127.1 ATP-binding cassette domain-containing protein [Erysipelothrix rhusiopathiae]MDV7678706.1 ATP-binding cassette domain-containing protein [Erysip